jgi:hypothetical protein
MQAFWTSAEVSWMANSVLEETTGGQEAVDEAEEMDQLILAIEDSSDGSSEATQGSEITDVAEGAGQPTQASEDDSSAALEVDPGSEPIKEAEEIDQLIQVLVEDNGSTNAKVNQDAAETGKEDGENQSIGVPGVDAGKASPEAGQELSVSNQTGSMYQLIQLLVDTESNSSSEIVPDPKSVNETEMTGQLMQMPVDDGSLAAETDPQIEIQNKTKSMDQMIQTLVESNNNADTNESQNAETIEEKESVGQLLMQTLVDEDNSPEGDDEVEATSEQDNKIIDEGNSMDQLILALEGSSSSGAQ